MTNQWVDAALSIVVAPLAALVGWFLGRKKEAADTDTSIVTGANLAVETMMQAMEELKVQVADLKRENAELRRQIGVLQTEIAKLSGDEGRGLHVV